MNDNVTNDSERDIQEHPRGTFVLLLIYLVITIGLWGSVYWTLWQRG